MSSGERTRTYLVLLVEDCGETRELYGGALRSAGLIVDEAATVGQAFDAATSIVPDLIVLDRDLPDGDGFDVARQLKGDNETKHIVIIAFSSHALRADVRDAMAAGCDAFLKKPCPPAILVAEVQRMLGGMARPVAAAQAVKA